MTVYDSRDMQEQIPELKTAGHFPNLVPLFDVVARRFVNHFLSHQSEYNASLEGTHLNGDYDIYSGDLEGLPGVMRVNYFVPKFMEDRSSMVLSLEYGVRNPSTVKNSETVERIERRLDSRVKDFVSRQYLPELLTIAREKLIEEGFEGAELPGEMGFLYGLTANRDLRSFKFLAR